MQKIDKRMSMKDDEFFWIDGEGRKGEKYDVFNSDVLNTSEPITTLNDLISNNKEQDTFWGIYRD